MFLIKPCIAGLFYIGDISAKNKKAGLGPLSQYDGQALTLKA
jgi:hypothetical protein